MVRARPSELHEARRIFAAFAPALTRRATRAAIEATAAAVFLAGLFAFVLGLAG